MLIHRSMNRLRDIHTMEYHSEIMEQTIQGSPLLPWPGFFQKSSVPGSFPDVLNVVSPTFARTHS